VQGNQLKSSSSSSSACPELELSGFHEVLPVFLILGESTEMVARNTENSQKLRYLVKLAVPENFSGDATTDRLDSTWKAQVDT